MANPDRIRFVGQIHRPGKAPENVELVLDATTGTLPDARLSSNVPRLGSGNQTWTPDGTLIIGGDANQTVSLRGGGGMAAFQINADSSEALIRAGGALSANTVATFGASSIAFAPSTVTVNGNNVVTTANGVLLTGNQTIAGVKTFSSRPAISSEGGILFHTQAGNEGGAVTVSTSDPSGTPADGDIWIKRAS